MKRDFWPDVLTNLFSSLLYTLVVAAIILIATTVIVRNQHRRLYRLLGLNAEVGAVRIYLSRLDVLPSGSTGTDGKVSVGFTGPALMKLEYLAALELESLLRSNFLKAVPRWLRRLVQTSVHALRDVRVEIDVSPGGQEYRSILENGTDSIVLVGSDVYSDPVRSVYRSDRSFVTFVREDDGEPYNASVAERQDPTFAVQTDSRWIPIQARSIGRELGTIQRVQLDSGRRLIMCAGISSATTSGSVRYLCDNWRSIVRRFDDSDFLIVLSFKEQKADDPRIQKPEEIQSLERRRTPRTPAPRSPLADASESSRR